jgi:uncharacterized protein YjbI with pentapeptide repeats
VSGASFAGSDLSGGQFEGIDWNSANFTDCDLTNSELGELDLRSTNLRGATLDAAGGAVDAAHRHHGGAVGITRRTPPSP